MYSSHLIYEIQKYYAMRSPVNILSVIIFSLFLVSCQQDDPATYVPVIDFDSNKKAVQLIESDNLFALDIFKEVNTLEEKENFMISPLSVSIALGMTYNGADGATKTAFEQALRLNNFTPHEINSIHGALIEHLMKVDPKVTMEIANSIWVNEIYTLLQEFADTNRYYYDAEINSLNFDAPDAVEVINNWVSNKTHEKITEVLDRIPPATVMYLINAIYYYGTWKFEFDENDNEPINFNFEDGTNAPVEGMRLESDLNYYQTESVKIAELPYGNDNYSMLLLLPAEGYTVNELVNEMDIETWNSWVNNLDEMDLNLHMPKFKFEYKTLLNKALSNMGMGVAFGGGAEFPLMVEESQDLFISRVIHKTFVDVNEEGTEAAAVTVVEIRETSAVPGSGVSFILDKPFLFVIREKTSNAIVFMGKVGKPEYD